MAVFASGSYDPDSITKYSIITEQIPRRSVQDPETYELIKDSKPVVITDTNLVSSASKWDLEYLHKNLGDGLFYVYTSNNNRFKYFDNKRAEKCKSFVTPSERHHVTFLQFLQMLKRCAKTKEKVYLQQTLNDSVGTNIVTDFLQFNWDWVNKCQAAYGWGSLSSNLLLIGLEGNITPVHYDEQENFFAQISGHKRCLLFSPDQFDCLYPHPVAHPCDRQSQVNIANPDYKKFPRFRNAHATEAIVGPGDVLYIPMYWWHQIESLSSDNAMDISRPHSSQDSASIDDVMEGIPPVTISVNFWYRGSPLPEVIEYPLSPQQRVSVMRNVEKMLAAALGDAEKVGELLRTMVEGRYTQ
ncbi:hypoxia-inducible factor 1-alpha inhibitor [Ciona intestinalis]